MAKQPKYPPTYTAAGYKVVIPGVTPNAGTPVIPGVTKPPGQTVIPGVTHTAFQTVVPGVPYAPAHGVPAHAGGSTGATIETMPVALRQKFLRAHGYQVDVDGVLGPQTATATKAFLAGTPAATWNRAWVDHHAAKAPPPGVSPQSDGGGGAPPPAPPAPPAPPPPAENPLMALLKNFLATSQQNVPLTFQQQQTLAKQQAQAALAPSIHANAQAQAQALADAQRNAQFEGNVSAALAKVLKGISPGVADAYQQAGTDQAAYAKGFSGDLQATAQAEADKTNAFLQSLGAPAGQMVTPTNDAANVLYGLGGAMPADSFAKQGALAYGAAAQLPQTAIGRGQQLSADALRAGSDERAQLRGDLGTIESGRPKAIQDALAGIQGQEAQNAANAQNQALLPLVLAGKFEQFPGTNPITGTPTKAQQGLVVNNVKLQQAQAKIAQGTRKLNLDEKKAAWKAATDQIKLSQKKKGARLSATKIQEYRGIASTIANTGHDGYTDKDGVVHPPLLYVDAIKAMENAGVPWGIAQKKLNARYRVGEMGRPYPPGVTISHTRPK